MKFHTKKKSKRSLKLIVLGGTTTVQKNMYVYEYGSDIVIFDCGIGFPNRELLGVDIVLPDFSYVLENIDKVKGIVITHGHEDHFGALPYLLEQVRIPIYSARLVSEFIKLKLKERNLLNGTSFNILDPDKGPIKLGDFSIDFFRINHSVPESLGYALKTPQGVVFHVPDYKFDWTPVMDKPFDIQKAVDLAKGGVLALCSDCLGARTDGFTSSEKDIQTTFDNYMFRTKGQVFITTLSSNISRIRMAVEASIKNGRKIVIGGRSMRNSVGVGKKLGYLPYSEEHFIPELQAKSFDQSKITYIVSGSFGQPESSLGRISRNCHKNIKIEENSLVIFSADPIPGVYDLVYDMIDSLTLLGAEVIYSDIQDNLHVSGHGSRGDHILLANLVKPKYHIPTGGTVSLMRAHSQNMQKIGVKEENILELLEGDMVTFKNGIAVKHKFLETKNVFIDNTGLNVVDPVVLRDRTALSQDGIFVAILKYDSEKKEFLNSVELVSRGFIYMKESRPLLKEAEKRILEVLKGTKKSKDWSKIKDVVEKTLFRFFLKKTGHTPLILPVIVEA